MPPPDPGRHGESGRDEEDGAEGTVEDGAEEGFVQREVADEDPRGGEAERGQFPHASQGFPITKPEENQDGPFHGPRQRDPVEPHLDRNRQSQESHRQHHVAGDELPV